MNVLISGSSGGGWQSSAPAPAPAKIVKVIEEPSHHGGFGGGHGGGHGGHSEEIIKIVRVNGIYFSNIISKCVSLRACVQEWKEEER